MDSNLLQKLKITDVLLIEAFKNWHYFPPIKDKEKLLYDFYILSTLPDPSFIRNIDLKQALIDAKHVIATVLTKDHLENLIISIASEISLINSYQDIDPQTVDNIFKDLNLKNFFKAGLRYDKLQSATYNDIVNNLKSIGVSIDDFLKFAKDAFIFLDWPSGMGGYKWANIVDAYNRLKSVQTDKNKMVEIDHVYDIQHNTNSVFSHVDSYTKPNGDYSWINDALTFKNTAKINDLIPKGSSDLQQFAQAVMKDIEFNHF